MRITVEDTERNGNKLRTLNLHGYGGRAIGHTPERIETFWADTQNDRDILALELVAGAAALMEGDPERAAAVTLLACIAADLQEAIGECNESDS